ncbi:unnamed protein product [Natator depressus]
MAGALGLHGCGTHGTWQGRSACTDVARTAHGRCPRPARTWHARHMAGALGLHGRGTHGTWQGRSACTDVALTAHGRCPRPAWTWHSRQHGRCVRPARTWHARHYGRCPWPAFPWYVQWHSVWFCFDAPPTLSSPAGDFYLCVPDTRSSAAWQVRSTWCLALSGPSSSAASKPSDGVRSGPCQAPARTDSHLPADFTGDCGLLDGNGGRTPPPSSRLAVPQLTNPGSALPLEAWLPGYPGLQRGCARGRGVPGDGGAGLPG